TRWPRDWSSDVCSSDLDGAVTASKLAAGVARNTHWAGVTSAGTVFKQTGGISGSLTATGTYDLIFPSGLNLNTGCTNLASGVDEIGRASCSEGVARRGR